MFVAHAAMGSRRGSTGAAAGMALGSSCIALLGLHAVMLALPGLFFGLKLVGAGYLLHMAWRMWNTPPVPTDAKAWAGAAPRWSAALLKGCAIQLGNPKTLVAYASVFAAGLPSEPPAWFAQALLAAVAAIEAGWYLVVALVFSSYAARAAYLRAGHLVDRMAACVIASLALSIAWRASG